MRDASVLVRSEFAMEKHSALNAEVDRATYHRSSTDGYV
jgi:hypothetical protein